MTYDQWLDEHGEAIGNWYDANKEALMQMCPPDADFALFVVGLISDLPPEARTQIETVGALAPTVSEIFGAGPSAKTAAA